MLFTGLVVAIKAQDPSPPIICNGVYGSRVFHYHSTQLTWEAAEQFCITTYGSSAHLASIHSEAENTCIAQGIPQGSDDQVWTGLTDQVPPAPENMAWVWTDGSSADYFNWNEGEPKPDSDEHCGRLYGGGMGAIGGKWNDDQCAKTAAFICERDSPPKPQYCPGTNSASGIFDTIPTCPAELFPKGLNEFRMNAICDSFCYTNCPGKTIKGTVTAASPTGTGSMCACYQYRFGVTNPISRIPMGGCTYTTAKAPAISSDCSKALWSFPITKFDESYDIGYGFGAVGDKESPYGDGTFDSTFYDDANELSADANWNWEKCFGRDPFWNPSAKCHDTYHTQTPPTCSCDELTNQTAVCGTLGGLTCSLGQSFTSKAGAAWSADNMVPACFPAQCSRSDIEAFTQYIVDEWVVNATDADSYTLTKVTVPSSCGPQTKKGMSGGEVAGITIGVVALIGAAAGVFMFKKRGGSVGVGGLGSSFMSSSSGSTSRPGRSGKAKDLFADADIASSSGSQVTQSSSKAVGKLASDYEEL